MAASVSISFPLGGLAALLAPRQHFAALCAASHLPRLLVVGAQVGRRARAVLHCADLMAPCGQGFPQLVLLAHSARYARGTLCQTSSLSGQEPQAPVESTINGGCARNSMSAGPVLQAESSAGAYEAAQRELVR